MGIMMHGNGISNKNEILSITAFCFLICWVASLPKTAVLFPQMSTSNVRILNGLVFTLATVFGVIFGQLFSKRVLHFKYLMLLSVLLCMAGTVLIYSLPLDIRFLLSLMTFVFFGLSLAFVSQYILNQFSRTIRIWAVGAIVFTRVFLLFISNVSIPSLSFISSFVTSIICIVIVIVSALLIDKNSAHAMIKADFAISPIRTTASFIFLLIYFVILSISKGILVQRLTHYVNYNPVYFSTGMIVSYVIALFFVIKLSSGVHLSNIIYVANSIVIIAIIVNLSLKNPSWLVLIIYSLLYFSFSINEVFCFDTLFEFGDVLGSGSLIFGIAFAAGSLGQLGGVLFYEFNHKSEFFISEFSVIILFSFLTLILPNFLIELSRISPSSVFRVSSIQYDQGDSQKNDAETTVLVQDKADNEYEMKNFAAKEALSVREKEVLDLLLKGLPSKLICAELFVSDNTLKSHIKNIYTKLGVHNRTELFLLLKKDSKQNNK